MKKTLGVIPARMASSRFPGKPLEKIFGVPMIAHCYERALLSQTCDELVIATPDKEIINWAKKYDIPALLTSHSHERATERAAEVTRILEQDGYFYDYILLLQGDEPQIFPDDIKELKEAFNYAHEDTDCGVVILTGEGEKAFCSGGDQKIRGDKGYIGTDGVPRLNILDDFVDFFVIVEGNKTWQNNPKKLNFDIKKFKKFEKKIIYTVLDQEPQNLREVESKDEINLKNSKILHNSITRDMSVSYTHLTLPTNREV